MIKKNYEGLYSKKKEVKEKDRFNLFDNKIDDRFKWHTIIYRLIQELNMRESEVYDMNYISVLNWLSFFKNKDEVNANNNNK